MEMHWQQNLVVQLLQLHPEAHDHSSLYHSVPEAVQYQNKLILCPEWHNLMHTNKNKPLIHCYDQGCSISRPREIGKKFAVNSAQAGEQPGSFYPSTQEPVKEALHCVPSTSHRET